MKALKGTTRVSFLFFFASHIVFTLLVDIQAILPDALIPTPCKTFLTWYATTFHDPLMSNPKQDKLIWFQSFIACEVLFQLPFFFYAVRYFSDKTIPRYPNWFGPICVIYGSHTATTLIPILAAVITNPNATVLQKAVLSQVYLPYMIFPLWILYLAAVDNIQAQNSIQQKSTTKKE